MCVAFCRFWSGGADVRAGRRQASRGVGGGRGGVTTSAFRDKSDEPRSGAADLYEVTF